MLKREFLAQLRKGLRSLPQADIEERLVFYSEMIDDRMEEGLTEEEAVHAIMAANDILPQNTAAMPACPTVEGTEASPEPTAWQTALLLLTSPLWGSLLLSLWAAIWCAVVAFWSFFGVLLGTALGFVAGGIGFACGGSIHTGIAMAGAGLVCGGLSVFCAYGCSAASKAAVWLTKAPVLGIKKYFCKKEAA